MPAAIPLDEFVKQLEDSGILARGKLEGFLAPEVHPKDAEDLATALVQKNQLTKFQAAQVLAGNTTALIMHNYTILDRIGAGGMGQVFKAEHRRMKRLVALKTLPTSVSRDPAVLARFQREVEAAAQLSHPNIVAAYDAGEANGDHFLVMEFIDGRDLSALVKAEGPLAPRRALGYILQAARGLEFAHQKGVIHRDVKPSNLLLDSQGTVKVLDMGLARIDGGAGLTGSGEVMGTVDYMAPEQAISSRTVDARADIYSLGCALYYLVTGKPPYDGPSLADKLVAHQRQPVPSLAAAQPGVSPELDAVFRKLVAKGRDERYPTMTEVIAALGTCPESRDGDTLPVQPGDKPASSDQPSDLSLAMGYSPLRRIDTSDPFAAAAAARPSPAQEVQPSRGSGTGRGKKRFVLSAAGAAGLVLALLAIVIIVRDRHGKEVTRLEVPEGGSFTIVEKAPAAPLAAPEASRPVPETLPPPGPARPPLPGIIPLPASLPGARRWQLETVLPRAGILSVCWSPDGERVALGAASGEIRIHETAKLELVGMLIGHVGRVQAVAWSPDGKRLASGGADGAVRLWEPDGTPGLVLRQRPYAALGVTALAWHPDGTRLVSGDADRVRFWSTDGKAGPVLKGNTPFVTSLAWSPDGQQLASAGGDRMVRLWGADGTAKAVLEGHTGGVRALAWNPDGSLLASCGDDATARIWKADGTAGPVCKRPDGHLTAIAWSPDGRQLAAAEDYAALCFWNSDGTPGPVSRGLTSGLVSLAWSPDGRRLVSAAKDGTVRFWRADGSPGQVLGGSMLSVSTLAWIDDGAALASGSKDRWVRLWNGDGTPRWVSQREAKSLSWSPARKRLAFAAGNSVGLLETDGKTASVLGSHQGAANVVAWNPAGTRVASGGSDKMVRLWDFDGTPGRVLKGFPGIVLSVAWSPDGRSIAAGGYSFVQVWATDQTGIPPKVVYRPRYGMLLSLAWNPDGTRLAIGEIDGVMLWSADGVPPQELTPPEELKGGNTPVLSVSWSPDGSRLVAGGRDGTIRFWEPGGRRGPVLAGDGSEVACVAWCPRGDRIAAGTLGGTIRFWDAGAGTAQQVILLLPDGKAATFGPDGALVHGDPALVEKSLVYCIETPTGRFELLKPAAFRQRAGDPEKGQRKEGVSP